MSQLFRGHPINSILSQVHPTLLNVFTAGNSFSGDKLIENGIDRGTFWGLTKGVKGRPQPLLPLKKSIPPAQRVVFAPQYCRAYPVTTYHLTIPILQLQEKKRVPTSFVHIRACRKTPRHIPPTAPPPTPIFNTANGNIFHANVK